MAVSGLEEFFNYKNRLMEDLLTNEAIVRLLDDDCKDAADGASLMYKQVFPYEYMPETVEHGQTFICCEVDIREVRDKTVLLPAIYIWEFTHTSKLRLPQGGIRTDVLASEIDKVLNGSRYYGFGELGLQSVRRFTPATKYQGHVMTYYARDFNRPSPTGMKVPANRRTG